MSHSESHPPIEFTQEFWDDRYRSAGQLWSGQPNPVFAEQAADLPPGEALDAGCGEGADAIWLARRGWMVTAVDVSAVALERGANAARAADEAAGGDIAGRITWRREDLRSWGPDPDTYDLVSAQFMHFPKADLEVMHRRLAAAVRPGGTLLMVAHHRTTCTPLGTGIPTCSGMRRTSRPPSTRGSGKSGRRRHQAVRLLIMTASR